MKDSEKYREDYELTLQQLFFKTRELERSELEKEVEYAIFNRLTLLISDFNTKVDRLQGERKINAQNAINSLIFIFNNLGQVYLKSLAARKRNFELSQDNLKLAERIKELETEIEVLKKIDEL